MSRLISPVTEVKPDANAWEPGYLDLGGDAVQVRDQTAQVPGGLHPRKPRQHVGPNLSPESRNQRSAARGTSWGRDVQAPALLKRAALFGALLAGFASCA